MPLVDEVIRRLAEEVKPYIKELVEESVPRFGFQSAAVSNAHLVEQMGRVERELAAQREDREQRERDKRFEASERRFARRTWAMMGGIVVYYAVLAYIGIVL